LESAKQMMGQSLWRIRVRSAMKFLLFKMEHAREPERVEDARKCAKGSIRATTLSCCAVKGDV
jgi:hypothetical protein